MADRKIIPAKITRTEIMVSNSRFIATAAPVFSADEARQFIASMKSEFPDATHNVPAYQIGHGLSLISHCNDDGEPSGTAGRPALAVLQGSGIGDIAVVVTRYFGGTKLGTGGLVRAYTDAVKAVLNVLPLAEKVLTNLIQLDLPYPLYDRTRLLIEKHNGSIVHEEFSSIVSIKARFAVEDCGLFQDAMRELSHGAVTPDLLSENETQIMPLRNGN